MTEPIRVVHVDDDPEFAELTGTYLERENERLAVTTATSAGEGMDRIAEGGVDCVVSDYDMPGRDGIAFLEAVRADHPDLPFILFTGKGSEEVAADAISAGATDYIQKEGGTGQWAVLANRIENVVEQYRARRRSERAARRRSQTLQRITDGYVEMDADLTITDVNEQACEVAGRPREELVGECYRDLVDGTSGGSLAAYEAVIETGEPTTVEARSDIAGGQWLRERVFPAEDGDGIFVYTRDVTERKERERELESTTRQLEGVLDSVQAVIWMLDAEDRFILANENFRRVLGVDDDVEVAGKRPAELFGGDGRSFVDDDRRARETGEPVEVEHEVTVDGDEQVYLARVTPLFDEDGAVFATAGAAVDITERKERERTLTALHAAAQAIARAEEPATVYETLIDTAENVLAFDLVAVDIARDGYLVQEAWELRADADYYDRTSLEDDDTLAVRAYQRGETIVVDDLRESDVTPADPDYRSALTVPIGRFGTFQAVASETAGFDDYDREFAELLVDHARVKLAQLAEE